MMKPILLTGQRILERLKWWLVKQLVAFLDWLGWEPPPDHGQGAA